ncbi:glutathione S-transferase-like [Daktulosphaira vitifoliae]|uniref:glutathione transferase n=1 Tax=Daktulosphaira vitifoliae TaxID=58002 RepID=A0A2I6QGR1_DAKVI|nr:glutathione S-transferase-like [Daktulosphaira vitifoliae]AUN35387.1 glutathione S-transferase s2 [Daktulosphaira vitifoliae]
MSTYKLTYFNIHGRAEPIRFLLSYLNINFEDCRIEKEQWASVKPNTPFGKLPMLEVDGKVLHQTLAICRYLGKKAGLAGDNDWESVLIDIAVDNILDFWQEIIIYFYNTNEVTKAELGKRLFEVTTPFYLDKFEKIVSENGGYFVNDKLSWADIFFAAIWDYTKALVDIDIVEGRPNLSKLQKTVLNIPQIKLWTEKRPKNVRFY